MSSVKWKCASFNFNEEEDGEGTLNGRTAEFPPTFLRREEDEKSL